MPKREREIEEDDLEDKKVDKSKDSILGDEDDDQDDGLDNAEARRQRTDEDEDRLGHRGQDDEDDDPPRGRRSRRNDARRRREHDKDGTIAALSAQIQQLQGAFGEMSRGQMGLAVGDLESSIRTYQGQLDDIDAAQALAVKEADDAKFRQAARLRDEVKSRLDDAAYRRAALIQQAKQPAAPAAAVPDPESIRLSRDFMDDFPDFDPKSDDGYSRKIKRLDESVARAGYNPGTPEYWEELRLRCEKAGLEDDVQDDDDDDREEHQVRRPARGSDRRRDTSGGLPPRSGRSNGGTRRSGAEGFRLTPLMRETLDQLGLAEETGLNKEQIEQRRKYVKQWSAGTKAAQAAGKL